MQLNEQQKLFMRLSIGRAKYLVGESIKVLEKTKFPSECRDTP